jgi:micrococcal nuclease
MRLVRSTGILGLLACATVAAGASFVQPVAPQLATLSGDFVPCVGGKPAECVVDGDTFHAGGQTWRIADIDAPEVFSPKCPAEKVLGDQATARLLALLDEGPVTLALADRDEDRYGRKLRILMRDGESLGMQLVAEGLAREWDGARRPWCA